MIGSVVKNDGLPREKFTLWVFDSGGKSWTGINFYVFDGLREDLES